MLIFSVAWLDSGKSSRDASTLRELIGLMNPADIQIAILAAADLLILLGSSFFVWRGARRLGRFLRLSRNSSFRATLQRTWFRANRQAIRCAKDVHYYLARLSLLSCGNLVGIAAVLFGILAATVQPQRNGVISPLAWEELTALSLLLFAAFAMWTFVRTVRLARKVMQVRRKMRAKLARKQRVGDWL